MLFRGPPSCTLTHPSSLKRQIIQIYYNIMDVKCQHLGAAVTILFLAVPVLIDLDNEHVLSALGLHMLSRTGGFDSITPLSVL